MEQRITYNEIDEILSKIDWILEEDRLADIYGEGWRISDWKHWRSITAGDLCNVLISLEKAEAKLSRNNKGSIGYRKGKSTEKAALREKHRLEGLISVPMYDYKVQRPIYLTEKPVINEDRTCTPKRQWKMKNRDAEGFIVI